jgi:uncharacterized membrane protein
LGVVVRVALFILLLVTFAGIVQFGLVTIAFDRLGLSVASAYLLLWATFLGSFLNIRLFTIKAAAVGGGSTVDETAPWRGPVVPGGTIIAVNVGGAVIPVAFSWYLFWHSSLSVLQVLAAIAAVAYIAHRYSRPIGRVGIGVPFMLGPIAAALLGMALGGEQAAPLAYIGGTLGVLIGADLLHLKDIGAMGVPFASIGGAGSFDGIFMTGMLAVLLA